MELSKRQEEIVKVALTLAAEGGVAVTIQKLAKALRITEPAIYRHFASEVETVVPVFRCHQMIAFSFRL